MSNTTNRSDGKRPVEYHRANLSEARNMAAQFILSMNNNEYDLNDSHTVQSVFDLVLVIFLHNDVFSSRFRDHTLTIAKKCCYLFLSKNQRCQLENSHRLPQYEKIYSEKFENTFCWRGVYVLRDDKPTNLLSSTVKKTSPSSLFRPFSPFSTTLWLNRDTSPSENRLTRRNLIESNEKDF